jgi:O-antigen/teichoic acid export membrane protein
VAAKENAAETFRLIATWFFLFISFFGAVVIIWVQPVIQFVAGKEFWDAYKVVGPLVYAHIASAMMLMLNLGMHIHKKTRYMSYIIALGAILNIILNIALIPKYGMLGAAYASFVSYMCINVISYRVSQRLFHIPFDKVRVTKVVIVLLCISLAAQTFEFHLIGVDLLYRVSLTFLFVVGLIGVKFFNNNEVKYFKLAYYEARKRRGLSQKVKYAFDFIRS